MVKEKLVRRKIKKPVGDIIVDCVNYFLLFILSLSFIIPFIYVISVSLSTEKAIGLYGITLIPKEFSIEAYKYLFRSGGVILNAYKNTIVITVLTTFLAVIVTGGLAYPLSKVKLPFRQGFMYYVLFAMLFGGGMIPTYLVIANVFMLKDTMLM